MKEKTYEQLLDEYKRTKAAIERTASPYYRIDMRKHLKRLEIEINRRNRMLHADINEVIDLS